MEFCPLAEARVSIEGVLLMRCWVFSVAICLVLCFSLVPILLPQTATPVQATSASGTEYVPIGKATSCEYAGIPFEISGVSLRVEHSNVFVEKSTIDLPAYTAKAIHMMVAAGYSDNIPDGVVVAHVNVYYQDSSSDSLDLVMGVNIAEWAYDRPEIQPYLQHSKVPAAYSVETTLSSNYVYMGHWFYVVLNTQLKPLDYLELTLDPAAYTGQQNYGYARADWAACSMDAITLEKVNQPPVASFTYSPQNAVVGEEITFDASSSYDPDGQIVSYDWDFGDGNHSTTQDNVITHDYANAGDYTANLMVTDNVGFTDTTTQNVQVRKCLDVEIIETMSGTIAPCTNFAIKAKITNRCNTRLDNVAGQISWSGPADGPVGGDPITWNLGSLEPGEMYVVAWTLHYNGPGDVIVYVTDPNHAEIVNPINNPWTLPSGQPPVASFEYYPENLPSSKPMVGGITILDASDSYDPDGGIIQDYEWTIDGTPQGVSDSNYSIVFESPKKYMVNLTVTDDEGTTSSTESEIDLTLENGDVLLMRSFASLVPFNFWTHVGIYDKDSNRVIEARLNGGVQSYPLSDWFFPNETCVRAIRINTSQATRYAAVAFASSQVGCQYDLFSIIFPPGLNWGMKNPDNSDGLGWYCSELVWGAYLWASNGMINLDMDARAVGPDEIATSSWVEKIVGEHREGVPDTVWQGGGILWGQALCPIDLVITDPDGVILTKDSGGMPGDVYRELDLDGDGELDDAFMIPSPKIGDYSISVIPELVASPGDTYSLQVGAYGQTIVLAENTPISEIPEQPYAIQSTEGGINAVPIAEANGPYIGAKGASIAFDSSGSYDPDGTISSYIWDFGDGSGGTGASLIHVYNCPGVYTITLSVIDDDGDVGTDTATVTVTPQPMKAFVIKNLAIQWAPHVLKSHGSDVFSIFGRLQLPQGYTVEQLQKQAIVSIAIADKSGNDIVVFKGQLLGRPQGALWTYKGNEQPPGEGMNLTNMAMWWAPQGTKWAGWGGFYVGGVLQLPEPIGVSTTPANVKVTLEIPITPASGCGSLIGEQTVPCKVYKSLNLWTYNVWPNLPIFPYEPTGKE